MKLKQKSINFRITATCYQNLRAKTAIHKQNFWHLLLKILLKNDYINLNLKHGQRYWIKFKIKSICDQMYQMNRLQLTLDERKFIAKKLDLLCKWQIGRKKNTILIKMPHLFKVSAKFIFYQDEQGVELENARVRSLWAPLATRSSDACSQNVACTFSDPAFGPATKNRWTR